jgi:hypothetical protein
MIKTFRLNSWTICPRRKKMKKLSKKVLGVAGACVVAAGLIGGGIGFALQPEPQFIEVPGPEVIKEVEVVKEVPVNVTVEKVVEVEDEAFLAEACDRLFYDDLDECREEVEAEDAALALAWAEIDDEAFDFLEDEGIFRDEDDLRVIKVYDDFEDMEVIRSDFDDDEYRFQLTVKYEDVVRDIKKKVNFVVDVEDGDVELVRAVVV